MINRPDIPQSPRLTCTAERPWTHNAGGLWEHPAAHRIREEDHDGGTCFVYKCPNCGLTFHVELPD